MNSDWRLPQLWVDRIIQVLGCLDHQHVLLHNPSNADVQALVDGWESGDITAAIISLPGNTTDTNRFQFAAHHCTLLAFTIGRIQFERRDWKSGAWKAERNPITGQAFMYFGAEPNKFNVVFKDYCHVGCVMKKANAA